MKHCRRTFHNNQTMTEQPQQKVSLNTIYNRVNLLKSKSYARSSTAAVRLGVDVEQNQNHDNDKHIDTSPFSTIKWPNSTAVENNKTRKQNHQNKKQSSASSSSNKQPKYTRKKNSIKRYLVAKSKEANRFYQNSDNSLLKEVNRYDDYEGDNISTNFWPSQQLFGRKLGNSFLKLDKQLSKKGKEGKDEGEGKDQKQIEEKDLKKSKPKKLNINPSQKKLIINEKTLLSKAISPQAQSSLISQRRSKFRRTTMFQKGSYSSSTPNKSDGTTLQTLQNHQVSKNGIKKFQQQCPKRRKLITSFKESSVATDLENTDAKLRSFSGFKRPPKSSQMKRQKMKYTSVSYENQNHLTNSYETLEIKPSSSSSSRYSSKRIPLNRSSKTLFLLEQSDVKSKPTKDFLSCSKRVSKAKQNVPDNNSRISSSRLTGLQRVSVYKKQLHCFEQLYDNLSNVLASCKLGIARSESAIKHYAKYMQSQKFSFIDDFINQKQLKLQKLVRTTRFHQTLSVCYLFLEIVQQNCHENQSYLVNFIGYSLSNLLLVARLYILKERITEDKEEEGEGGSPNGTNSMVHTLDFDLDLRGFQPQPLSTATERNQQNIFLPFQNDIKQVELNNYGKQLTSLDDVLLRIQHNNEIITMIHKRLGRNHQKFQLCIRTFLKNAERKAISCSHCSHYIFQYLAMHIHEIGVLGVSPTLQLAPQPYTPPSHKPYTLVIQPVGILQKSGKRRPYLNQFIKWAAKHFDIVLWTWEMPYNIMQIQKELSQYAVSKLYRHHCTVKNQIFVKDLSRLQRDLQKVVIIDYDKRIFAPFIQNGIECRWRGNLSDKKLLVLSQILEEMVTSNTNIKDTLTLYSEQIDSIKGY